MTSSYVLSPEGIALLFLFQELFDHRKQLSLSSDIVDDIMGFFLALFRGLRVQMGVTFTEQTIHTFMNLFTRLKFLS